MRRACFTLVTVLVGCVALVAGQAAAERVELEKPVPVNQKKADKSKISGRVVAYDDEGFDLKVKGETQTVRWDELDARTVFVVRKSLLKPKDALAHVELGRMLLGLEGGKDWAEKAFTVALKIDPGFKEQIDEIKKDPENQPGAAGKKTNEGDGELIRGEDEPPDPGAAEAGAEARRGPGPKMVGGIQEQFWGPQTDEQQAAAVEELKAFAAKTQKTMGKELRLNETTYFLFYSELSDREAKNWSGVLDRMYKKLAEMFAVEKDVNIWRGKALVFVFQTREDYVRFQAQMHQTNAGQSDGMCHTFGSGMVHIAFYRQPDEVEFAHVLVHESVHGFIHRYKTPARVPVWVNEGLAEWIASQLVPRAGGAKRVHQYARLFLQRYGGTGNLLEATSLDGWQYLVAEMITTFMIEKNRKGYVAFVKALKDGAEWKDALKTHFRATPEQLIHAFGQAMNVRLAH